MPSAISRREFFDSEEALQIRQTLQSMTVDPAFNTKSTYTVSMGSDMSFVDKHMKYLGDHPKLNPQHYISNLRLMTRLSK